MEKDDAARERLDEPGPNIPWNELEAELALQAVPAGPCEEAPCFKLTSQ